MAFKLIQATQAKPGTAIMVDGVPCTVKSNDISSSGRHGHSKCRIEAIGIIDNKKRVIAVSGHDRFEVPMIDRNKAQVLSITEDKASIMDLASYETIELPISEELKESINDGDQVEYWDVEGNKIIKKKI